VAMFQMKICPSSQPAAASEPSVEHDITTGMELPVLI